MHLKTKEQCSSRVGKESQLQMVCRLTVEIDMKATTVEKATEFYLFGCLDVEAEGHNSCKR